MLKSIGVGIVAILCVIYIINPGAGVFELIPDNIPFFGNLDEATAVMLLLACLRYFNIDITNFFRKHDRLK